MSELENSILDDLQAVCQKHNIGIIHTGKAIEIRQERESSTELLISVLYLTPGRMGYYTPPLPTGAK